MEISKLEKLSWHFVCFSFSNVQKKNSSINKKNVRTLFGGCYSQILLQFHLFLNPEFRLEEIDPQNLISTLGPSGLPSPGDRTKSRCPRLNYSLPLTRVNSDPTVQTEIRLPLNQTTNKISQISSLLFRHISECCVSCGVDAAVYSDGPEGFTVAGTLWN